MLWWSKIRLKPPSPPILLSNLPDRLDCNDTKTIRPKLCPPPALRWKDRPFLPAISTTSNVQVSAHKRAPKCRPSTPLFIGFASQSCMLEQTLLSYLVEGWPSDQIVVFDNSGHAHENVRGTADPVEHYFLDYNRLRHLYGVALYQIPVRLSFSQFQNLLLTIAEREGLFDYFWTHQDVVVQPIVNFYPSLFHGVLAEMEELGLKFSYPSKNWALGFFDYDRLAHVNTMAAQVIGRWDTMIPYYPTDCDYYGRARSRRLFIFDFPAARFYDIGECLPDPHDLLGIEQPVATVESQLIRMAASKSKGRKAGHF
ncbi:hypothetical protein OHC33_011161 [Knufia fluminis]|uniref:Uncharacterized protein n=1 Tax=Knufia fluminis TaxID=191047 RepID=A0AAN8EEL6_9EURO|nr:hypothetical protein OHC33_011161 [Knufia fluminis]